jgi:hypothetical protein
MTNYSGIANSCLGKHDKQLQKEMNEALKANGILNDKILDTDSGFAKSSFERRRGRICIVVNADFREQAKELVEKMHPEFKFHVDEYPQGKTHFLYFKEVINL